jgi:tryptophan-rich sensory protein
MNTTSIAKLIASLALCFLAAYLGSIATMPAISTWYALLNKPFFNPPNWIFGPVWTLLYFLMAVSAWLIWQEEWDNDIRLALSLFAAQLALNVLWSFLFFNLGSPLLGFVEILFLWLAIFLTVRAFFKISSTAGWLMVPYILWVTFAAVLNLAIVLMNL